MSGLEAIGVAASIVQVADLGTKLSVQLFSLYRRYKNANESIQLLSNEIALVSAILRELGDNLKEEESSKLCSEEAFRTLRLVLTQCRDVLGQIERVIDGNDRPGKGRLQHVVVKAKIVLLEPSLAQLKINLERLKSTMLLLLNVIMYAGQLRSNNVPVLVQEQRDLLQSLLDDRQDDKPNLGQPDEGAGSPRGLSTKTTHPGGRLSPSRTEGTSHQKQTLKYYLRSKNQSPRGLTESTGSSGSRSQTPRDTERNEPPELKEYNILIQSMLHEIDSCRSKLEKTRHLRIKDGVLNIHSGEIMRFKSEYGDSIHIDHSLFAEQNSEAMLKPEVTGPTLTPTSSRQSSRSTKASAAYPDSDESDFSEIDISIHGLHGTASFHRLPRASERSPVPVQQPSRSYGSSRRRSYERARPAVIVSNEQVRRTTNTSNWDIRPQALTDEIDPDGNLVEPVRRRASGVVSGDVSSYHRDYELLMDQRVVERSHERNEVELWRQQQEIDRLEREMERHRKRNEAAYDVRESWLRRGKETLDEDEMSARLRRLEVVERLSEQELKEMAYVNSLEKKAKKDAAGGQEISRDKHGDTGGAVRGEDQHVSRLDTNLETAVDTVRSTSPGRIPVDRPTAPRRGRNWKDEPNESAVVGRGGDDAQEQAFADLSLPDNLEDLLAQWTTLDKQEIQRGQIEAY